MPPALHHKEQNYTERVARVVAAIVADPTAEHRLDDLARLAHFSPFHFHRIYSSIAGETVASTVRRVRLALATRLLEANDQSVTQVATAVGYDSPQAFTRAFGQFTGQSPRAFQQQMQVAAFGSGPMTELPVQIIERSAQSVRALRHHGSPSTIPHTQRRLHLHAGTARITQWLGISFGDPNDIDHFRYYAAAVAHEDWPDDGGETEILDLPAGRYVQHCLAGPYSRINAAINALYVRWLPVNGYELDDRPTLEQYLNSPRTASQADLRTNLLIPIRSDSTP